MLDLLERQADRDKDFATVAWTLEKRLAVAEGDPARLVVLQKLGSLYADRLADHAGAAKTWRRVLEIQPGHPKALRVLRDAYLANDDFDGLEELYASQNDWEGLAEVFSTAADRTADPDVKVDLSFRTARLLTEKIGSKERAFRSYERILSVRADDVNAATALVEICEAEEKWARLPALYAILLGATDDEDKKLDLLHRLVEVTGNRLGERIIAVEWAFKAYELAPADERLEELEQASRAAKSWDRYLEAVTARLRKKKGLSAKDRRGLRAKLARLQATELGRIDDAISDYRALVEEDPSDEAAVSALDKLLRSEDRREQLRWLFELRATHGPEDERAAILTEWASLEQDVFNEPGRAAQLYARVLKVDPGSELAARTLPRLLLAAGNAEEAAKVIESHLQRTEGQVRAERELDLADIYIDHLQRPAPSARSGGARARNVASFSARGRHARSPAGDARNARPGGSSSWKKSTQAAATPKGKRRRSAFCSTPPETRAGVFRFSPRSPSSKSNASRRRAARSTSCSAPCPSSPTSSISGIARARSPPRRCGPSTSPMPTGARSVRPAGLRLSTEVELCERAATLHDDKLADPEAATPYLERILERRPGDARAFARLKQILTGAEKWGELEGLYAKAIQGTTDPERRVDLLNEVALVCEEITNEAPKAIGYYEAIFELDSRHDNAIRALEMLYAREGRYEKLAGLLEHRLQTSSHAATPSPSRSGSGRSTSTNCTTRRARSAIWKRCCGSTSAIKRRACS